MDTVHSGAVPTGHNQIAWHHQYNWAG